MGPILNIEVGDHANQQHSDGSAFGCRQFESRCDDFTQVQVCLEHCRGQPCDGNRERVIYRRQIDDRNPIGSIQPFGTVDLRVWAIRCAASVGSFRGKHCDFHLGEFDLFDQRWRQELLGEHFAGQWNVHAFGAKSAGCQRQRVESQRG